MSKAEFEWDPRKDTANIEKHGVSFFDAQQAFLDQNRIIAEDAAHSKGEIRYYCFGKVQGMVMTVRFTYIPLVIQESVLASLASQSFDPQK